MIYIMEEVIGCAVCGDTNAKRCSRCRLVTYCGKDHQRQHWKIHKQFCKKSEIDSSK